MGKLLISKGGFKVQEIELKNGTLTVGRAKDNDIQLNDPTVSAHHAKIVSVMRNNYIEDLDSKNGVFINGERVVVQALEADDVIAIGQHELFFREAEDVFAMEHSSVSDTAVAAAVSTGKSAMARDASVASGAPPQTIQQQSSSTATENSLRVVVDNSFKPSQKHSLDIDISFEKFINKSVSGGAHADTLNNSGEHAVGSTYISTFRNFESFPHPQDSQPNQEPGTPGQAATFTPAIPVEHSHQDTPSPESGQQLKDVNEGSESVVETPDRTERLVSKQPFMSSEEVVNHLIELNRERNKARQKPRGLSSLLTVITFGLIAAAIYFQLQLSN